MTNSQDHVRNPSTWEATLLAAILLVTLIASAGILSAFSTLSVVLVVGQLLFIVPTILWSRLRRLPLRDTFQLNPIPWHATLWSAAIGLACWPIVAGTVALLERPLSRLGAYPASPLPGNLLESGAYVLALVVLAPLTEEPAYRGLMMRAWLRRGPRLGIVIPAMLFGLLHSQIAPLLPLTAFGVVLGILVSRTGSVLSSVVAHASYNTAAALFIVVPSLQSTDDAAFMLMGALALPVAVVLVWRFVAQNALPLTATPQPETTSPLWSILALLLALGLYVLMATLELAMRLYPELMNLKTL
jgi:membrane protease YdiL (CAAX protease family)